MPIKLFFYLEARGPDTRGFLILLLLLFILGPEADWASIQSCVTKLVKGKFLTTYHIDSLGYRGVLRT